MLPAAVPDASIFTYDWDANYFGDAPVQTLLGHADTLLSLLSESRESAEARPVIFVASCFGGLVVAEALTRAAQEGSPYRSILLSTVGVVFLATPFRGSDAATQAQWQVVVGGIMGERTSDQLVRDLENKRHFVHQRVQKFAEVAHADTVRLPLHCFYETKKTEMVRWIFPSRLAKRLSSRFTYKLLVTESSACLDGSSRYGLTATHSGMNKFNGPGDSNFKQVKEVIQRLVNDSPQTLAQRSHTAIKRHLMVPFGRNKEFVGREQILDRLVKCVHPTAHTEDCQRVVIEGLGGTGKTQIALEICFRIADRYPDCSIFWVPAVNRDSFDNAYRQIGKSLGLPILDDKEDVMLFVKEALSQEKAGNWLLIIDNADDIELLFDDTKTQPLCDYFPFSSTGSILLTTRNHKVTSKLDVEKDNVIHLQEMHDDEAMDMFRQTLSSDQMLDIASTASLLNMLANLPLAIKQASAFMVENKVTTTQYLDCCQSSDEGFLEMLSEKFEVRGRYASIINPVATTWLISFEQILRDSPLAAEFLKFICYLSEKDIPESLFPLVDQKSANLKAIGVLQGYAFLTRREGDSFDMHRLVRLATQSWIESHQERIGCLNNVLNELSEKFPFPEHEGRATWTRNLPHVQAVLGLSSDLEENEARCDLVYHAAQCYSELGNYSRSEQMFRQALELISDLPGEPHSRTVQRMIDLALVLDRQGDYDEAKKWQTEAFELASQVLGKQHYLTLRSLNNLALDLEREGKLDEAEKMNRELLELKSQVLGAEHPSTLASMHNLSSVLHERGKFDEAEEMARKTLEVKTRKLGEHHQDTLDGVHNLALLLKSRGKLPEAEEMLRRNVALRLEVAKEDHPRACTSLNSLGGVLHEQGKHEEAERVFRQAFELVLPVLGEEHPTTVMVAENLEIVRRRLGALRVTKAEEARVVEVEAVSEQSQPG